MRNTTKTITRILAYIICLDFIGFANAQPTILLYPEYHKADACKIQSQKVIVEALTIEDSFLASESLIFSNKTGADSALLKEIVKKESSDLYKNNLYIEDIFKEIEGSKIFGLEESSLFDETGVLSDSRRLFALNVSQYNLTGDFRYFNDAVYYFVNQCNSTKDVLSMLKPLNQSRSFYQHKKESNSLEVMFHMCKYLGSRDIQKFSNYEQEQLAFILNKQLYPIYDALAEDAVRQININLKKGNPIKKELFLNLWEKYKGDFTGDTQVTYLEKEVHNNELLPLKVLDPLHRYSALLRNYFFKEKIKTILHYLSEKSTLNIILGASHVGNLKHLLADEGIESTIMPICK